MFRKRKLYGTTDGTDGTAGALTVTDNVLLFGRLQAVHWIDGTFADGVDAVLSMVSDDGAAADTTLLTLTDANDDAWYYPQTPAQDNTGVDVTSDGTNEIYTQQIVDGRLKLAVTSGGNEKTGGCIVYIES
jgi:hypothetical protein